MVKNKKKLFIILGIAILVYLNYFKNEREIEERERMVITTNVTYTDGDYVIQAGRQLDNLDRNESQFEAARAKIREMLLTSDNAFLDRARNLILKNNILGIAPNGWNFSANELSYDRKTGEISTTKGIRAEHKERGVVVTSREFTTDSEMSFARLREEVAIEGEKIKVIGDKGDYLATTKIVTLQNNIKLTVKNRDSSNSLSQELTGEFSELQFNTVSGILTSETPYEINYNGLVLTAEKLMFNQNTNELKIYNNIKIRAGEFVFGVDDIVRKPNDQNIYLVGPIIGESPTRKVRASSGIYNPDKRELTFIDDIIMNGENGEKLVGDKVIYSTKTHDMVITGIKKKVFYTTGKDTIETREIIYNTEREEILINEKFSFSSGLFKGTGKNLVYNRIKNSGIILDADIVRNNTHRIKTQKIELEEKNNNILIPETFSIEEIAGSGIFISKNAVLEQGTNMLKTESEFSYTRGETIIRGTGFEYNVKTGNGKSLSEIELVNSEKNIFIRGDRLDVENASELIISGNVLLKTADYKSEVEKLHYTINKKLVKIEEVVKIVSLDGNTTIQIENPVLSLETMIIMGNNFIVEGDGLKGTSNKGEYNYKTGIMVLIGEGRLSKDNMKVQGERIEYNPKSSQIEIKGDYIIENNDIMATGNNIIINRDSGFIQGDRVRINSNIHGIFQSDRILGNLNKTVSFIGRAVGETQDNSGRKVNYRADRINLNLKRVDEKESFEILGAELIGNAVLVSDDTTLNSSRIVLNNLNGNIVAYNRPVVTTRGSQGIITVTGDRVEFIRTTNIMNINGNVIITTLNDRNEEIVARGSKGSALLTQGRIELEENVTVESSTAILYTDRMEYIMSTRVIRAFGNTRINHIKIER